MGKRMVDKEPPIDFYFSNNKLTHARARRKTWDRSDYEAIISAYECKLDWKKIAILKGMPSKTAFGIIERFRDTGRRCPLKRGSSSTRYNASLIMDFVCNFLSKSSYSNFILADIQALIWQKRSLLLKGCDTPPSIDWIARQLRFQLHWTRKRATIEPQKRNNPEIIMERRNFVLWLSNLSHEDAQRLVWQDEHGVNYWTISNYGWSPKGTRVNVKVPSGKGHLLSVLQCSSIAYGKISMRTNRNSSTSQVFHSFCEEVLEAWDANTKIPPKIKALGPIMLIDGCSIHNRRFIHPRMTFKKLPRYSPFMNLAEFVNREHKSCTKQIFRRAMFGGLPEA